jgi:mRNA interferase YafQ
MRSLAYTRQFEKDVKRLRKRGKDLEKLKMVIRSMVAGEALDAIHRDHKVLGSYRDRHVYHFIESDWLLVYKVARDLIIFERSGSHLDLFQ